LAVPSSVLMSEKNFALTDANKNLYFAFNRKDLFGNVLSSIECGFIYFNFLEERS
jgi:hypothetical protein